jgi:hypothetical protein
MWKSLKEKVAGSLSEKIESKRECKGTIRSGEQD